MRSSAAALFVPLALVLAPARVAAADDVAPVVAALQGPPLIKAGAPAEFTSKADQPGRATLKLAQRVTGSRVGDRCVARTRSNRSANRCPRVVTVRTIKLDLVAAGAMRFTFRGFIAPGRYAVTLTFTGVTGLPAVPRDRVLRVRTHPKPTARLALRSTSPSPVVHEGP